MKLIWINERPADKNRHHDLDYQDEYQQWLPALQESKVQRWVMSSAPQAHVCHARLELENEELKPSDLPHYNSGVQLRFCTLLCLPPDIGLPAAPEWLLPSNCHGLQNLSMAQGQTRHCWEALLYGYRKSHLQNHWCEFNQHRWCSYILLRMCSI